MSNSTERYPGSPLQELQDLRVTFQEFWRTSASLGRELAVLISQLCRLTVGLTKLAVPWLLSVSGWFWRFFRKFTPLQQATMVAAGALTISTVQLLRRGLIRRVSKRVRTSIHKLRVKVRLRVNATCHAVRRVYSKLVRVGTVWLPGLAVTVPLRLYASRTAFRHLVSLTVTAASVLHAVSSLVIYYNKEKHEVAEEVERQGRRRTQEPNRNADKQSSRVACWLNYFVLAEILDWGIAAIFAPSVMIWGKPAIKLGSLQRGVLTGYTQTNAWKDIPVLGNLVAKPEAVNTTPEGVGIVLEFTYALCFVMLVMHAMNNNRRDLLAVTRRLVQTADWLAESLVGRPLIEDPPQVVAARRASIGCDKPTGGLLPQAWALAKIYLPAPVIKLVTYMGYVPQLLLLLLPGVLLGPAYVLLASLLPVFNSYKALTDGDGPRQAYHLVYFTAFNVMELTVMRWLREQGLWTFLPLQGHRDVLYITILQLVCHSPHLITHFVAGKFAGLEGLAPENEPPPPPPPQIKQERISSDEEGGGNVRQRTVPSHRAVPPQFRTSLFTQKHSK